MQDLASNLLQRYAGYLSYFYPNLLFPILAHQSHLEYEGKRLWENQAHHFRDLCKDGANSGTGGKWAILIENEESEKF